MFDFKRRMPDKGQSFQTQLRNCQFPPQLAPETYFFSNQFSFVYHSFEQVGTLRGATMGSRGEARPLGT